MTILDITDHMDITDHITAITRRRIMGRAIPAITTSTATDFMILSFMAFMVTDFTGFTASMDADMATGAALEDFTAAAAFTVVEVAGEV